MELDDRYRYCDDLAVLELVMLGDILTEYNFLEHVASDIPLDHRFLPPSRLVDAISSWTDSNLMRLNEAKTDYTFFTRSREQFCTRLTVNHKVIEKKEAIKLLGVWLQPDCGWEKNTHQRNSRILFCGFQQLTDHATVSIYRKVSGSGTKNNPE